MGGGPAGLAAAIATGRMNRRAVCLEAGTPRTAHAPCYHNYLGFPRGISGQELLGLGREQARRWGAVMVSAAVTAVEIDAGGPPGFVLVTTEGTYRASGVVFATGVKDRQLRCGNLYGETRHGVHYCVVCDGLEVRGQRVAVVGSGAHAVSTIEALRDFTSDLHLLVDGEPAPFPHVFIATGVIPRTDVAQALGCRLDDEEYIATDERQATSVPFVYAAGDCDGGRKQVTQAMAEGETAGIELARQLREAGLTPQPAGHRAGAEEPPTTH